jgi:hypothetical protein
MNYWLEKTLDQELNPVLKKIIKTVNYINSKLLKSQLYAKLCEEMGSQYVNLILHTEIRWLSTGHVLSYVCKLKGEVPVLLILKRNNNFVKMAVFWVVVPCKSGRSLPTFQRSLLPPLSGQSWQGRLKCW